jgi:hypothetical protein
MKRSTGVPTVAAGICLVTGGEEIPKHLEDGDAQQKGHGNDEDVAERPLAWRVAVAAIDACGAPCSAAEPSGGKNVGNARPRKRQHANDQPNS